MRIVELLKKKFLPKNQEAGPEPDMEVEGSVLAEPPLEQEPASPNQDGLGEESLAEPTLSRRAKSGQFEELEQAEEGTRTLWQRLRLPTSHPIRRYWRRYHVTKILLLVVATFALLVGTYLFYLAKTARVSDLQTALQSATVIYDRNGEQAGSLSGQKGTYVELDAISDDLELAVLATEDRTFYENKGINFQRTALAVLTLGRSGGGSTITQQLAKNAYLTQDQTIKRKAREFFLALELTKKYSKDDILTMYLNHAYFGNGVWGVEDASQKYFGVPASQLSLDEAATLAGMLKGPEIYNPYYSLENATNRRDTVLQNMVNAGYLSQEVADQHMQVAMSERLSDTYAGKVDNYAYPSYFDAVINEAISVYGISEKDIINNGYRIYTELDQNYQLGMQATFDNDDLFPVSSYDGEQVQGASVALDPATGGVRGLVGRVNSTEDPAFRSFNYATQSQRSPASTIKPLLVYTPAIASGWTADTLLPNSSLDFNGYTPNNFGGYQSEDVPMYQALAQSYNIPAVYSLDQLGLDKGVAYGKKFGLNMNQVKEELGMALGGGVTTNPLELAQAYAVFANGGVMEQAHLITRIEKADGQVIADYQPSPRRVISQSVADKMTSMMLGTFSNGTGVNANVYGYTLAGKTGTSETDFDPNLAGDQWVVGYTPDVVISQWIGFDKTDEQHYLTDASGGTASAIFSTQASYILPYTAGTPFLVDNSYAVNGISPEYVADEGQANSRDIIEGLRQSAQEAADQLGRAAEELAQAAQESGLLDQVSSLLDEGNRLWQEVLNTIR